MLGSTPLTFVMGKGGVGKSTVAAGLALTQASRGASTALIEFTTDQFATLFDNTEVDFAGATVAPGVTAFSLHPRDAFADYASRRLHSKALYRAMLDNRVVHYFLDATPGVNEIMCLGRLWEMVTQGPWDHCVVDLPATGHGLGFLRVPRVITTAVHHGPVFELGERIRRMLEDPAQTAVIIASLCEELPVNETVEIVTTLHNDLQIRCDYAVANRMMAQPIPPALQNAWRSVREAQGAAPLAPEIAATAYLEKRWHLQQKQFERLQQQFGRNLRILPELAASAGLPRLQAVAHAMATWNGGT